MTSDPRAWLAVAILWALAGTAVVAVTACAAWLLGPAVPLGALFGFAFVGCYCAADMAIARMLQLAEDR